MARLPFQQATVLPQQNRLSAPNVPNAPGPMDVSVPGGGAQNRALMSLGESIARIGRTAADIYLTQAEKEKDEQNKIAIVEYGQFRDRARNQFFQSLEQDPPADMADALARYEQFYSGGDAKDLEANGLYQQTQRFLKGKSKRVQKAVTQMFDDKRIADQDLIAMQEIRKQQQAKVGAAINSAQQGLTAKLQSLTPEDLAGAKNYDPTQRRQLIATDLENVINPTLEGLSPGLRRQAEERLQTTIRSAAEQLYNAQQSAIDDDVRADYVRLKQEIITSGGPREERLAMLDEMQSSMFADGLLSAEQAAVNLVNYEREIDNSDIKLLRNSGDIQVVAGLLNTLLNDKESFPSLSANERAEQANETKTRLETLQKQATQEVRRNLLLTVGAILDPNLTEGQRAEVESVANLEQQLANVPDENTKLVFKGLHSYALQAKNTVETLPEKTEAELAQAEESLVPPRFIGGDLNADVAHFSGIYNGVVKEINAIRKLRADDGASFAVIPEGTDPLDASNLDNVVATQLEYKGFQNTNNLSPSQLRGLHQAKAIRLLSKQTAAKYLEDYLKTTNGDERFEFMMGIERRTGSYGSLVVTELARKRKENGIGLPYYSQLYTEVTDPAVRQNMFDTELNSKSNRSRVRDIFKADMGAVRAEMMQNESFQNFYKSFESDRGSVPLMNDFNEFMTDYVLEMGARGMDLGDAVDMAADHLIGVNFTFIQPNAETPPLLLRNAQLDGIPAGSAEVALTNYTETLLAERRQGFIDLAGSDDLYTWAKKGDDSGLELLFFNEERAQYVTTGVIMPFTRLRVLAERHMNNEAIDSSDAMFAEDQAVIDTMLESYGVGQEMLGLGVGKPIEEPEGINPVNTGKKTSAGRVIWKKNGEEYSEITRTVQLETGKWITTPTVDKDGNVVPIEKITKFLNENGNIDFVTGKELPVFDTEKAASKYAEERSNSYNNETTQKTEPEPAPEDPELAQLNGFVTQARAFLDTVPGEQMVEVERLIEGAEVLRARIVYNKGKEAAMKQLRLLETQLQLLQGKTASKEQMRKLLGSQPELDPELRAEMEALLRSRQDR
uniref:Uncharacterized protein n=1 Tax=uncultured marine microorganism HF4000_48F7 TaxID=455500 RepID=B3SZU4_9ZZZZ|nr:hypothetical protein ALOHA_HF400048F7ctg1g19 [uncultured marine microorganism HF4000_48F7]